jgi:hypothetical protein
MVKLSGKLKTFSLITRRLCEHCESITKRAQDGKYLCPKCGLINWRYTKRLWFAIVFLDIFDSDVTVIFLEKAISQMLNRVDISWQMLMDRLKGLRDESWLKAFLDIKKEVDSSVKDRLTGNIITVTGSWSERIFAAKNLGKTVSPSILEKKKKFVSGKLNALFKITDNLLSEYKKTVEVWEEMPVLRFKKTLQEEDIEIGIRAPLAEYGKAYRVWMRINQVHMYPAKPVRTGHTYAWVLRAYHTKGWEDKLENILSHCLHLEEHAVKVVQAARKIDVKNIMELLRGSDLLLEEKDEIVERWNGGSLWNLAEEASKVNRSAGVYVLKKFGLLKNFLKES